jgi:hypothetical protein
LTYKIFSHPQIVAQKFRHASPAAATPDELHDLTSIALESNGHPIGVTQFYAARQAEIQTAAEKEREG